MGWGSVRHGVLGAIWRPGPRLSVGGTFTSTFADVGREGAVDLALRPWGNERLTLYADYARTDENGVLEHWSHCRARTGAGADRTLLLRPHPERWLTPRARCRRFPSPGAGAHLPDVCGATRSGSGETCSGREHVTCRWNCPSQCNTAAMLSSTTPRVCSISIALLERAHRDPAIKGLVINASGLRISPALGWELREKLRQISAGGKRVVVYIDRVDLSGYHWVSAADHLVLDPAGMVGLQGYVAGYTYFKGRAGQARNRLRRVATLPVQIRNRSVCPPATCPRGSASS